MVLKKIVVPMLLCVLMTFAVFGAMQTSAEGDGASEESIPANTPVTYGYLEQFREQLKEEIIAELQSEGGITVEQDYKEVSAKEGETIILHADTEVIYRGGGAAAITSSDNEGEGITDMSEGTELFSGMPLEYGHIYYASASESKKAILITGDTAYFTIRGEYEIG